MEEGLARDHQKRPQRQYCPWHPNWRGHSSLGLQVEAPNSPGEGPLVHDAHASSSAPEGGVKLGLSPLPCRVQGCHTTTSTITQGGAA
jgi:hypothetical protein